MIDWKWFGWALAGSAFTASTASYAARQLFHVDDVTAAWVMGGAFAVLLAGLFVAKVRYEAWWRRYRLTADSEASSGDGGHEGKRWDGT